MSWDEYDDNWEVAAWDKYCDSEPYVRPVHGFIPNQTIDVNYDDIEYTQEDEDKYNYMQQLKKAEEHKILIEQQEDCLDAFFNRDCNGHCSECAWWSRLLLKNPDSYISKKREQEKKNLPLDMFLKLRDEGKFSWG